jgi:hypothetical protein
MGVLERKPEFVDQPGDERELLGRADRAADADGVVRRGLLPGCDVFQGLGETKSSSVSCITTLKPGRDS